MRSEIVGVVCCAVTFEGKAMVGFDRGGTDESPGNRGGGC